MPTLNTICYYAMYVIGEVESRWTWTSVNYNDPITIGMMQWYGTRAAALLILCRDQMPSAYANLAASLRSSLETYDATSTYWNSRYLNYEEGNSIVTLFSDQAAHSIQETQAIQDFTAYISTLESWGMSQSDPKPLIFAMSMYHQSPAACGRVLQSVGGSATLELLYTTALNDSVLSNYYNRYTTVYERLKAWNGESDPPDFGQNGNVNTGGGDSSGITQLANQIGYVKQWRDLLVIYGKESLENGLICYPASGQTWIPSHNAFGDDIEGGWTGGGSGNAQAVVDLYVSWVGRFAYSQGAGRLDPIASGYGDCSSTIWFAYHEAAGIDVGTWTEAMLQKGTLIIEGSGVLDTSRLVAGDLIIYDWDGGQSDHVEMYIGNDQLCGHGGPANGPTIKNNASTYGSNAYRWWVRRYM